MSAIANGIALHGGFIPFVATFLVFSDYARNAIRMSALMGQRVVYVFTHDSIALGEDGPTHQPIEHVESLRLIPNLDVWRPADAVETAFAWRAALARRDGPTAIVLSRQNLPAQPRDAATEAAIANGGYVLSEPDGQAGGGAGRHRLGGRPRHRRPRPARRSRASRCGWCRCRAARRSSGSPPPSRPRCSTARRRMSRSRPA